MRKHIRILIAVLGSLAFTGVSSLFPAMLERESIRLLLAIYGAVSVLLLLFYRRLHATTGAGALEVRQLERFTMRRSVIRGRMWTVALFSTLCACALWLLSLFATSDGSRIWFSLSVGFFASVGVAYCLTIIRWIIDLDDFSDKLRLMQEKRSQEEAMMKRLSDRNGAPT